MRNLLIRIVDIPETGVSIEGEDSHDIFPILKDLEKAGECQFISPVRIRAEVKAVGQVYRVHGAFNTDVQLTCSRCLSEFKKSLKDVFDLTFAQTGLDSVDQGDDQDKELSAEEIEMTYFEGEEIDLKDVLQQQLVMSLSQRPLCKETCKGLCQRCGANLNEGNCRCTKDQINNGFEILKGLKLEK